MSELPQGDIHLITSRPCWGHTLRCSRPAKSCAFARRLSYDIHRSWSMHNANHFIKCGNCGAEFVSAFAGENVVAVGCVEQCPNCQARVATPHLSGVDNFDSLQRAIQEPMHRQYGKDGYVFMGHGYLASTIRSSLIVPVHAAYRRNIQRVLELLDIFYEVDPTRAQVVLSTIYISTMTAYECLTEDLRKVLQRRGLVPTQQGKKRLDLRERREHLFSALGFTPDGHVTALDYLYAFRNCLTHQAGVVDEDFLRKLRRIDLAQGSSYTLGQPLILDASTATSFADSLQQVAQALLLAAQALCDRKKIK